MSHPIIEFAKTPSEHHVHELFEQAKAVQARAYAPYSHFLVGAAILSPSGNIYVGCNVENAAYGLTLCAETAAITAMIHAGYREIHEMVVIGINSWKIIKPNGVILDKSAYTNLELELSQEPVELSGFSSRSDLIRFY